MWIFQKAWIIQKKVDDLDVGKLKTSISDAVDNEVVKNIKLDTLNAKVNSLEKKIPDTTTLIHVNKFNTNKKSLEQKMEMLIKKYQMYVV